MTAGVSRDVERQIAALILSVLKVPSNKYSELLRADIPEWDSLKHMELILSLEEQFEVQFREDEFSSLDCPAAIAAHVCARRAA